ncbi:helix-turn-helix domain-containing protein [Thiothrix lacustris]|uniref:helix-turn-helix domain-containing protein n=1 Tax=Thiothrix lacustris TaxID=525917 RepID=UPI0027E4AE7C|nr:helix-turn-helix transcriptional regulator [Thiothrix lacustris]WMP15655.1 helix-turn-helix transcriptional regulator [Thiothrix lacustris]
MSVLVNRLVDDFADKDYAHSYMESHTISRIAAQIYALRKQRNWSQKELAKRADITQERVCKIECGDFTSLTLSTLRKFSDAFDVHLHVEFTSFNKGILDVANLNPKNLEVASREDDFSEAKREEKIVVYIGDKWRLVNQNHFSRPSTKNKTVISTIPENIKPNEQKVESYRNWHDLKTAITH